MNIATRIDVDERTSMTWANIFSSEKPAPMWEQALITLWFFLTYVPVKGSTAMLYLLVLAFMGILAMDKQTIVPVIAKTWPLYLLPIFGLMSFMWSPHSSEAFRQGLLLILTALTIVIIASRTDIRHALRCLMFAGWMATIMAIPYWNSFHTGAMYGSKNYLAIQVTFMMLISCAAALNKRELLWVRLAAIPFIPLGFIMVLRADSATSLVFAVIGPVLLVLMKLFWVETARFRNVRPAILMIAIAVILVGVTLILSMPSNSFVADFLGLVGKKPNLSGRTTIWMAGRVVQDQYPLFGTGLAGFWNPENGAAQSINFYDFKPFGTKLSFHNSYMEVRVHLGLIGFWLFILIWVWCTFRLVKTWLKSHDIEASLMIVTSLLVFMSTHTESWAFGTFNTPVNLLYLGAVATLGATGKRLVGRMPVIVKEMSDGR